MKFGQHLLSHLTPEWREQYVAYEDLKTILYAMIEGGTSIDEVTGLTAYTVNNEIQDEFLAEANKELQKVEDFFRAQEARAIFKFRELKRKATAHQEGLLEPHQQWNHFLRRGGNLKILRLAFREFYLNLILLQNYQELNYTAFLKILKKHDKLATSDVGSQFFKENVHHNYFCTSKEVGKLIADTENTFAICLESGDKSRAMKKLRVPPFVGKMSHWVTLRTGLFNGMILVSIVVIVIAAILHPSDTWPMDWKPFLSALRAGMLVVLALYGFATNTCIWRTTGVNSTLIFEFNSHDYCSFTQLYEIASLMGIIWIICVYLFVFADWVGIPPEVGPSVILLAIPMVLFLPLPVFYWRSRLWLMKVLGRVVLAPFCHVTFADFWLADQLNSLARVLLDVVSFCCWVAWGNHHSGDHECGLATYAVVPIFATLPAWFRFAQCLRRYYDTRKSFPHLVNAGKYSTTFFVVLFSTLFSSLKKDGKSFVLLCLWMMSAFVNTCYAFAWDIKMDWGLFNGNYYLREQLIYSKKIYYAVAICEDLVLRFIWTLGFSVGILDLLPHSEIAITIFAILEVFRRFVWNFFRLEAEHLNNIGEFRAVRNISLHPIKITEKDDILSPLPQNLQYTITAV